MQEVPNCSINQETTVSYRIAQPPSLLRSVYQGGREWLIIVRPFKLVIHNCAVIFFLKSVKLSRWHSVIQWRIVLFLLGFDAVSGVCFSSLQRSVLCWSAASNSQETNVWSWRWRHYISMKNLRQHVQQHSSLSRRIVCSTSSLGESQIKIYFSSLVNPFFYLVWFLCETFHHSK
jgi:hypothetical protein